MESSKEFKVPCIVADDLSDQQIKAYRLADNKVAEFAEWDFNILNLELDEPLEVEGRKAMHPSGFGIANEDIYCRCTLLQRAKWALGEDAKYGIARRKKYLNLLKYTQNNICFVLIIKGDDL